MYSILSKKARLLLPLFALGALMSSTVLMFEKLKLLADPKYVPSCSLNPVFSCSGPMQSWQESALGVPNPIIGMIGFAVMFTVLALVAFGVRLPRLVWEGMLLGSAFAYGYCMWLMWQTLYVIGALCIQCMIIWFCVIMLFWLLLKSYITKFHPGGSLWAERLWLPIVVTNVLIIAVMIYFRFELFFNSLF